MKKTLLIMTAVFALVVFACDNGNTPSGGGAAKDQSATISNLFEGVSATVKGKFTDAER